MAYSSLQCVWLMARDRVAPSRPLLYVLVMEQGGCANLHGISAGARRHKLALYLLFPNIIKEFERFGQLSNFNVNSSKTEALNRTYDEALLRQLLRAFPFKWPLTSLPWAGRADREGVGLFPCISYPTGIDFLEQAPYIPSIPFRIDPAPLFGNPDFPPALTS